MYIYTSLRASQTGAIRGPRTVLAVGGPLARACFLVCGALHGWSGQSTGVPGTAVASVP